MIDPISIEIVAEEAVSGISTIWAGNSSTDVPGRSSLIFSSTLSFSLISFLSSFLPFLSIITSLLSSVLFFLSVTSNSVLLKVTSL